MPTPTDRAALVRRRPVGCLVVAPVVVMTSIGGLSGTPLAVATPVVLLLVSAELPCPCACVFVPHLPCQWCCTACSDSTLLLLLVVVLLVVAAAANWQPGDEAITPNPDASKAFFAKWAQKSK